MKIKDIIKEFSTQKFSFVLSQLFVGFYYFHGTISKELSSGFSFLPSPTLPGWFFLKIMDSKTKKPTKKEINRLRYFYCQLTNPDNQEFCKYLLKTYGVSVATNYARIIVDPIFKQQAKFNPLVERYKPKTVYSYIAQDVRNI